MTVRDIAANAYCERFTFSGTLSLGIVYQASQYYQALYHTLEVSKTMQLPHLIVTNRRCQTAFLSRRIGDRGSMRAWDLFHRQQNLKSAFNLKLKSSESHLPLPATFNIQSRPNVNTWAGSRTGSRLTVRGHPSCGACSAARLGIECYYRCTRVIGAVAFRMLSSTVGIWSGVRRRSCCGGSGSWSRRSRVTHLAVQSGAKPALVGPRYLMAMAIPIHLRLVVEEEVTF
ncbi:hypothetical protein BJ138DRAFT_779210 [Hygrophoropsis aurantiaca]|uniref:Uncharacterized protein n=1 Tax=Hygrophoropsis aurantiaca TaxID=72124 RepID=A0ACB8AH38_9AGAM|nr:hypothetical protein BJ138DRAFT_779210 [Hygrophoropsis aurantiaca]